MRLSGYFFAKTSAPCLCFRAFSLSLFHFTRPNIRHFLWSNVRERSKRRNKEGRGGEGDRQNTTTPYLHLQIDQIFSDLVRVLLDFLYIVFPNTPMKENSKQISQRSVLVSGVARISTQFTLLCCHHTWSSLSVPAASSVHSSSRKKACPVEEEEEIARRTLAPCFTLPSFQ